MVDKGVREIESGCGLDFAFIPVTCGGVLGGDKIEI